MCVCVCVYGGVKYNSDVCQLCALFLSVLAGCFCKNLNVISSYVSYLLYIKLVLNVLI